MDKLLGEIRVPSGSLLLVDPQTLADPDQGAGQAGVIEGLPKDRALKVYVTYSDVGPWIDALRIEIEKKADGGDETESIFVPATHQVILIDSDASDGFELEDDSHYGKLTKALDDKPAAIATISDMSLGIAMLALQSVESQCCIDVRRRKDRTITQVIVNF